MATMAQPGPAVEHPSYAQVTRDIAATLGKPSKGYFILLGFVVTILAIGFGALLYQIRIGLGVAGYTPPVMWGVYITTFVFWVGIAHSGTLISAILYLFRSAWRTSVYRTAEAMTVFAVMTAGLFPLIHVDPVPQSAATLGQLQITARVGSVRHRDILHGEHSVSHCRVDSRHCRGS
jgi:hypothetical protein